MRLSDLQCFVNVADYRSMTHIVFAVLRDIAERAGWQRDS